MSSKKDRSAIVSGAGLLTSIFTNLVKEVKERGGDDEDIHRLTTPEGSSLLGKIADLIVRAGQGMESFSVLVRYNQSLAEIIKMGKYGWENSNVTAENFPLQGEGEKEVEVMLFHFGREIKSEAAINEMDKAGYRPATIKELLALGYSYPELQKQFPVVALGSVCRDSDGHLQVPCLDWHGAGRLLDLDLFGLNWGDKHRFAAVLKPT